MAVPLGVLAAIYLHEYGGNGRLARLIRFMSDVMTGVPSIIMGLFIFVVFTLPLGANGLIGFGGSLALACLMLPIVIRSSEEMLRLVPDDLRQASYALGNRKWRTIMTVVLPAALGGMVSGIMLAVARAAGETAPLLFTIGAARRINWNVFDGPNTALSAADLEQLAEPVRPGPEPGLGGRAHPGAAGVRVDRHRPPRLVPILPQERVSPMSTTPHEPVRFSCLGPRSRGPRAPTPIRSPPPGGIVHDPRPRDRHLRADRRRPPRAPAPSRPARRARRPSRLPPVVFDVADVNVYYGGFRAIRDANLQIRQHEITAFIGPSGCGKSTMLRCFDRMNDLIEGARVEGTILYHGVDLYGPKIDPVEVRKRIGMVFQKPNPFPKSIYDNVAFGARLAGHQGQPRRDRREGAAPGGAVGRGQGPAEEVGHRPVGRPAAAAVHRPRHRRRSPRSSSWTSRARPSTRSPPPGSRT